MGGGGSEYYHYTIKTLRSPGFRRPTQLASTTEDSEGRSSKSEGAKLPAHRGEHAATGESAVRVDCSCCWSVVSTEVGIKLRVEIW